MALARRHAAARPDTLGFLHVDGHARVYYGTRTVQKTHVARLKFPAPATVETWVTGQDGDPVFMVIAEPSDSLAGELRRLLPELRAIVGQGRRVTVCFDRGGWSPALFADITGAGFDLLTWRKGPAPDLPADAFTAITCADDRGREHRYDLADTTVTLSHQRRAAQGADGHPAAGHPPRPRPRRRDPADPRADLPHRPGRRGGLLAADLTVAGGELLPLRPHPLRPGRPGLPRRHARRPGPASPEPGEESRRRPGPPRRDPRRRGPGPARRQPGRAAQPCARPAGHDHQPDDQRPGRPGRSRPPRARGSGQAAAATPARIRLGTLAPDMVRLEAEVKQITHAIRMAAYNAETTLARALDGRYARAGDEAYALIREALTASGDIIPGHGELLIRLDPLTAPRRTQALAALCDQLNQAQAATPAPISSCATKSNPTPALHELSLYVRSPGAVAGQLVMVAILARLWASTPCPYQIAAPCLPSRRVRSQPQPRLR